MNSSSCIPARRRTAVISGFTLPEILTVLGIFSLLVAAMVAIQLFAGRIYGLAATKLSATTGAREALNAMRDNIRAANTVLVGTYSPAGGNGFSQISNGQPQIGNAVAVYFTTNAASSSQVVFYRDPTNPTNVLCSVSNGVVRVLASYMTNFYCFRAEDYQGNVLTNYLNNPVIRISMQFSEWGYPLALVSGNGLNAYNYQLRTRVTRRAK